MVKMSRNLTGSLPEPCTKPTNNEQIHDVHSTNKKYTHYARDKTYENDAWCTMQKHEHNTAMDDCMLSWSTPRYLTRNIPKSSTLSSIERCQGWVPSESLEKFLLEVNSYN
jgi:hypothetical protein